MSHDWAQTGFENLFLDLYFSNLVSQGNPFKPSSKIRLPDNAALVTHPPLDDMGLSTTRAANPYCKNILALIVPGHCEKRGVKDETVSRSTMFVHINH